MTRSNKIYITKTYVLPLLLRAIKNKPLSVEIFKNLSDSNWNDIFQVSLQHSIDAIVFDAVRTLPEENQPPKKLKIQWAFAVEDVETDYNKKRKILEQLAEAFAQNNIKTMLLKGMGLSKYYPVPQHRESSDIDIYLYGKKDEGDKIIEKTFNTKAAQDIHIVHSVSICNGILVENHKTFIDVLVHSSNKKAEDYLVQMSARAGEAYNVPNVYLPPVDLNAFYLLRHASGHFAAQEITLRNLTDWYFFITNNADKINFDACNKLFKSINMQRFVNAVNQIMIDYFGVAQNVFPDFKIDKTLANRVFDEIIAPEFDEKMPDGKNLFIIISYKIRRFFKNAWKHKIVYSENVLQTFFKSMYSHLLRPKSIKKFG